MFWLWALLIYWVVLFVACYVLVESGQNYFYDEITPKAPLKVGATSLILAALLTWRGTASVDMFTTRIGETALLAILAFVLFTLVLRFHPPHAAFLGPISIVLVAAATTLAIESLADGGRSVNRDQPTPREPLRKSVGGPSPVSTAPAESP